MLHIVAWGCTWHGCWIEGNNHKYEGRNERESMFISIHVSIRILKHHSSEEYTFPYISLRLFACLLTWVVAEQHTYEWSLFCFKKKHLSTPLLVTTCYTPDIYSPILYSLAITFTYFWTLWLADHSYISFPLLRPFYIFLNPLATTLTSLFPYYTPFTFIFEPFGYHSYIPFPLLHPFYILLNPSPKGWHYSIFAWQEPYLLEPNITLRNLMTKVQLQLTSLQKNKTSQKHLCGCQPSGHAWHRKLGLSQWSPQRRSRYSKHDLINVSSKNINEKA